MVWPGLRMSKVDLRLKRHASSHADTLGVGYVVPAASIPVPSRADDRLGHEHLVLEAAIVTVLTIRSPPTSRTHGFVISNGYHISLGRGQRRDLIVEGLILCLIMLHNGCSVGQDRRIAVESLHRSFSEDQRGAVVAAANRTRSNLRILRVSSHSSISTLHPRKIANMHYLSVLTCE